MSKLRQIRALLEVTRVGRVARAAKNLNVSQPAVTRAIQALENEFSVPLFERTQRRMIPTKFGEILTHRVERAFNQLHLAENELGRLPHKEGAAKDFRQLANQIADHELRAVIYVDEFQNVTAAARQLGISQPAVNRSLKNLENRLGIPLFERTPQGMRPTPGGKALIRRAKLTFSEIRQGTEEMESLRGGASGRVKIGVLPLSRVLIVPRAVSRLLENNPEADVSIVDGMYPTLLNELLCGDIDMIVGTIREATDPEEIASEQLFEDDVVIAVRAGHPLLERDEICLHDLAAACWVLPFKGVPLRLNFESMLESHGLSKPRHFIETDSLIVVRSLLLEGDRFAVVSRHQVYHEEMFGLLKILPISLDSPSRPVGITTRSDYFPTPFVRELQGHLRAVAAEIMAETKRI